MTMTDLDDDRWMAAGACAGADTDLWHPEVGNTRQAAQAKSICLECPVREECLAWAITHQEQHGIWGGMSPRQRQDHARGMVVHVQCTECGKWFVRSKRHPIRCSADCSRAHSIRRRLEWDRANRARRPFPNERGEQ